MNHDPPIPFQDGSQLPTTYAHILYQIYYCSLRQVELSMAPSHHKLKVLEQWRVSSHPSSATLPCSLPSTFFDLVFYCFHPVQRLLFYESTNLETELPKLKHSLALALSYYYPLAGSLTRDSEVQNPELLCSQSDFVPLTVAVSRDDFYELSGDHARDMARFHPLVPPLTASSGRQPVFAVQVTMFADAGVAIGTTVHHAVADGSSYTNFMKLWSSIHRLGELPANSTGLLPFLDRSVVHDPAGLQSIFVKDLQSLRGDPSLNAWDLTGVPDVKLATFAFSRDTLDKLRRRATCKRKASAQTSPYALACGLVWAGLVRARGDTNRKKEHFGFVTGCRARTNPPIPANYFGNCLGICRVEAERSELVGEDGAAAAADAIWKVIKSLEEGAFSGAENWIRDVHDYAAKKALTVAGSPKLGIYDVDFGWGRPRKVELVSIERTGALSLTESRGEKGGIEVGLALPKHEMDGFLSYFVSSLLNL
nr:PREDICTED: phenolic glucoside malonyltransferase 2-like [Musa acuminata subsp. malaccensis]